MTIKPENGKTYLTASGAKVGPMCFNSESRLFYSDGYHYTETGKGGWRGIGGWVAYEDHDLIAEWIDEPDTDADGLEYQRQNNPLPYGHARLPSGKVVDLTAITTPFGLLDEVHGEGTQAAMRNHGGPYEFFRINRWMDTPYCDNAHTAAHRVKPKPPAPVVGEVVMTGWITSSGPSFSFREMDNDTHRLTLPTRDGQLVPGTYAGPHGLVVKVEAL